jgi:hypothetical protein
MSNKSDQQDLEKKEQQFIARMEKFCLIDKELQNLVKNYNEGLESLSLMRFENTETSERISPNSYTIGPAYTLIEDRGDQVKLIRNQKNPEYFKEEERLKEEIEFEKLEDLQLDEPEENFEAFKQRMASSKKEGSKSQKERKDLNQESLQVKEDEIFNRFGALAVPPRIYAVKKSFDKLLDNVVNLVNGLRSLHSMA